MVVKKPERGPSTGRPGRLQCPFCHAYEVERLFVASVNMDSCLCASCGATWDEESDSGRYRGQADSASVLMPRQRRR